MATFSSVTRQHVLQALAEYDDRGADPFLELYGFAPARDHALLHEGRRYDARAVLGVAHRYATGRLATAEEFHGGPQEAAALLRRRGFEVSAPAAVRSSTSGSRRPSRTSRTRPTAAREAPAAICPTCSMALPATGVCDDCG